MNAPADAQRLTVVSAAASDASAPCSLRELTTYFLRSGAGSLLVFDDAFPSVPE